MDDLSQRDYGKGADPDIVTQLNRLNERVRNFDDIQAFRQLRNDDDVVEALLPYASGQFSETRVPATFVLGNVVDNTNVCRVIAYLLNTPNIDPNGRFNLLMVVTQVANYAYADTALWIDHLLQTEQQGARQQQSVSKTVALLSQLEATLTNRKLGRDTRLLTASPRSYDQCISALAGANADIVEGTPPTVAPGDWTTEFIRKKLDDDSLRRLYAASLVESYNAADDAQRRAIVAAVVASLYAPPANPVSGRVNRYVALAISRLPSNVLLPDEVTKLQSLTGDYFYQTDPTMKATIDSAIQHQAPQSKG